MSFSDTDLLSERELIVQYIIQCKRQGLFLSASEQRLIEQWISLANNDTDLLLLALSAVMPNFYNKSRGGRPPPINFIDSQVRKLLKEKSQSINN